MNPYDGYIPYTQILNYSYYFYAYIEPSSKKIKKYLEVRHYESKIVFYQEEIFRINGKYIVIKDNESVAGTSIDKCFSEKKIVFLFITKYLAKVDGTCDRFPEVV